MITLKNAESVDRMSSIFRIREFYFLHTHKPQHTHTIQVYRVMASIIRLSMLSVVVVLLSMYMLQCMASTTTGYAPNPPMKCVCVYVCVRACVDGIVCIFFFFLRSVSRVLMYMHIYAYTHTRTCHTQQQQHHPNGYPLA